MSLTIIDQPLPYVDRLPERPLEAIEQVVIHCTELPELSQAREYGERVLYEDGTGNSGHYYIDRDGTVVCYVPTTRVAHHVRGHNPDAIGIELVNRGRYPHWWDSNHQAMTEAYPAAQITALKALLGRLCAQHPKLSRIAGHEDLDTALMPASNDPSIQIARKLDPGPQFPWAEVMAGTPLDRSVPAKG